MSVTVCEISKDVVDKAKKFRLRKEKTIAALILKIDKDKQLVQLEEEYEDTTIEEIKAELSPYSPRYIILSYVYHHDDGRVSYPLCLVFFTPQGSNTELQVMYSGSVTHLVTTLDLTKKFEIRDLDDFEEDWLKEKLAFFR